MISLDKLKQGDCAKVVNIEGGRGFIIRLHNLGISEGVVITKIAGVFRKGPVVVKVAGSQVALGMGMASKVMVKKL